MELSKEQKDAFTPGLHAARLKHIRASYEAAKKGHAFIGIPTYDEQIAIIDALLAAEEQQPVAWILHSRTGDQLTKDGDLVANAEGMGLGRATPLYLHPQQGKTVKVPNTCPRELRELIASHCDALFDNYDAQIIWDACRAAILGNEPVTTAYTLREGIRREHATWSQSTFGDVGPVGPLKHLSKEAIEAAEAPDDLSEWADMQFLLWDAQRRAGITDEQITQAMIEKLAVNKARIWPEPKDDEPRLHIKAAQLPEVKGE